MQRFEFQDQTLGSPAVLREGIHYDEFGLNSVRIALGRVTERCSVGRPVPGDFVLPEVLQIARDRDRERIRMLKLPPIETAYVI